MNETLRRSTNVIAETYNVVEPIDMGCGILVPVRSSMLALVGRYEYSRDRPTRISHKQFTSHAINVTLGGCWEFRHGSTRESLTPGAISVGATGDEYGCAHSHVTPNSNLILGLSDAAIDEDAGVVFERRILQMPQIATMIQRAVTAHNDEQFHSRVYEIFDLVSQRSRRTDERSKGPVLRIQRVKRFIEYHASEQITLADMASVVGVSAFACLRQFKAATGMTPYAYLMRCRAIEASRLLKKPLLTVAEVATQCGFTDQAYFSRFFKNYAGMTPTQYRRACSGFGEVTANCAAGCGVQ